MLRIFKFLETGSRMVVAGGWEAGRVGNCCFVSTEFQFYKMERVLETESGDGADALTATERCL